MTPLDPAAELIETSRALWGGEAQVFRRYWTSPERSRRSDLTWIARQCHKELVDGVAARLSAFAESVEGFQAGPLDDPDGNASESDLVAAVEEFRHLRLFAALHRDLQDGTGPALTGAALRAEWGWPENSALAGVRERHRRDHGRLGRHVTVFTEGGGATLYAEGARLAGGGGDDDRIAAVLTAVHGDEVDHCREGLAALRAAALSDEQWTLLRWLTVEQLQARITMRNAQFGHPLSPAEVHAARSGECEPAPFDPA